MTKKKRIKTVLEFSTKGVFPDRPPYSFWHHFDFAYGEKALTAHLNHLQRYDLDFLKVMNDNDYPLPPSGPITKSSDLKNITPLSLNTLQFERQLELIFNLKKEAPDVYLSTTIFNPWNTLRNLTVPHPIKHGPPSVQKTSDKKDKTLSRLLKESREGVKEALLVIAENLARFSKACIEEAGADGVFYSVRDDRVDTPENGLNSYQELVKPADDIIANSISKGVFNILHICGSAINFNRFLTYKNFQVINWADKYAKPTLKDALKIVPKSFAICCGLNNLTTLVKGTPTECIKEAKEALETASNRPIIVAPGCTYDPALVPEKNLLAVANFLKEYSWH